LTNTEFEINVFNQLTKELKKNSLVNYSLSLQLEKFKYFFNELYFKPNFNNEKLNKLGLSFIKTANVFLSDNSTEKLKSDLENLKIKIDKLRKKVEDLENLKEEQDSVKKIKSNKNNFILYIV
jgi:replicative superfamily II helicase